MAIKVETSKSRAPEGPQRFPFNRYKRAANNTVPFVSEGRPINDRRSAKWMALLGYREEAVTWQCGGTIITQRHVLTAAHCVKRNLYVARLGEVDHANETNDARVDFLVKRAIPHENYTKYHNDIAVLVLDGSIDFKKNKDLGPICLPVRNVLYKKQNIQRTYVEGWGETEKREVPTHILYGYVNLMSREECVRAYRGRKVVIDERVVCAGDRDGGHDACSGDSGGPLVTTNYIVYARDTFSYQLGVISYGYRCTERRFAGVYTNVSHFMPWIEKQVLRQQHQ